MSLPSHFGCTDLLDRLSPWISHGHLPGQRARVGGGDCARQIGRGRYEDFGLEVGGRPGLLDVLPAAGLNGRIIDLRIRLDHALSGRDWRRPPCIWQRRRRRRGRRLGERRFKASAGDVAAQDSPAAGCSRSSRSSGGGSGGGRRCWLVDRLRTRSRRRMRVPQVGCGYGGLLLLLAVIVDDVVTPVLFRGRPQGVPVLPLGGLIRGVAIHGDREPSPDSACDLRLE